MGVDQTQRLGIRSRVGRAGMRRHLKPGMLGGQSRREVRRHAGTGAKEEQGETPPRAHGRQWKDEVNPRDWSADLAPLASSRPYDAGSVGQADVGGLEHSGELIVLLGLHDELWIDRRDQVVAAGIDQ